MSPSSSPSPSPAVPTPARVRRAQVLALALIVLAGIINYMDRSTLAVANSTIRSEFGVSLTEMGLVLSAFSWSYAFAQLPVGGMVDRLGPRRLLGGGLALWSLAQAAGGMVLGFGQLIATRVVLGIGEAPQFPSAAKVVSNWFPRHARGTPTGIFNAASPLGSAIAPPILTLLMVWMSWRWMFALLGLAGLVVALVWLAVYRDPAQKNLDTAEIAYLTEDAAPTLARGTNLTFAEWRGLFGHLTTWGMILGFFGSVYLNWVYISWLPGYLVMARHMSLTTTGFLAAIPFFCGFIGCLVAGWISDKAARLSKNPVRGRVIPVALAMFGMAAFTAPAALAQSNVTAIVCISVVIFLANAASACSWSLVTVVAPPSRVASMGALQNFGGFIGGSLAPILTGAIAEHFSFVPALLTGAAFAFVGALLYLFLVREPIAD